MNLYNRAALSSPTRGPQYRYAISSSWIALRPDGWMKCNFNAHISPYRVVGAAVFHDSNGQFLVVSAKSWKVTWDPMLAEAMALRYGCTLATRLGVAVWVRLSLKETQSKWLTR